MSYSSDQSSSTFFRSRLALWVLGGSLLLSGCDKLAMFGIEDPMTKAAKQEGEAKAVGGGCRHSGRAIEDCYSIYTWLPKAAIYQGWREMDEYMRENKISEISPVLPPPQPPEDPKKKKKKKTTPAEGEAPKEEVKGESKAEATGH